MQDHPLVSLILPFNPCNEALRWLRSLPASTTPAEAWELCSRGGWMLWLVGRVESDRKLLVLAACDCAEQVLHLVPADEERPRKAIETARRWARGEATIEEVETAAAATRRASHSLREPANFASFSALNAVSVALSVDPHGPAAQDAAFWCDKCGSFFRSGTPNSAFATRTRIPWSVMVTAPGLVGRLGGGAS